MKSAAVPGASPPDLRHPEPLAAEPMQAARAVENDRERLKIHRLLLTETLRRLRAGRTLERQHGVIHPECTAIVRDALRLTDLVYPGAPEKRAEIEADPAQPSEGAEQLAMKVARSSVARVAAVAGFPVKTIRSWAAGTARPDQSDADALADSLGIDPGAWSTNGGTT